MSEPLDNLLAQMCSGDSAAANEVFVAFEPYLRKAVRRHMPPALRSKFDSTDILQSVWVDIFSRFIDAGGRFVDADHFRGFLFVATRNRLIDRIRQHQKALEREEPLEYEGKPRPVSCPGPRPSEIAQARDLWDHILDCCPIEHRLIVLLKRQGYSLAEIGERTGLHPDSVRRILRALARKLVFK